MKIKRPSANVKYLFSYDRLDTFLRFRNIAMVGYVLGLRAT